MNKINCLMIISLLFSTWVFSQVKTDTFSKVEREHTINIESQNQDYINYLKDINQQSQTRFDNSASYYNNSLTYISALTGLFALILAVIAFFGFFEYRKIKEQRKEFEKIVKESNKIFTEQVRNRVKNYVLHQSASIYHSLEKYDLANKILYDMKMDDEFEEFSDQVNLLKGRVKYQIKEFNASKFLFTQLLKSKYFKKESDRFTLFDMLGANNHGLFKQEFNKQLVIESIELFQNALKLTKSNYDKLRVLGNIQSSYSMIEKYNEVIKIYSEQSKNIEIGDDSQGKDQDMKLQIHVKATAIHAYWKLNNQLCFQLFDDSLKVFDCEIGHAKDYLVQKLYIDPVKVEQFISEYKTYKANQS